MGSVLSRCARAAPSRFGVERFNLVDHPLDQTEAILPELRVAGVEPEGLQKLGMMFAAAGGEHVEVALGEAFIGAFVDRVERIHHAIAERISIDVERRVDEMADIGPERFVTGPETDRRPKTFGLHLHPNFAQTLRGELALPALGVDLALARIEGDLAHDRK